MPEYGPLIHGCFDTFGHREPNGDLILDYRTQGYSNIDDLEREISCVVTDYTQNGWEVRDSVQRFRDGKKFFAIIPLRKPATPEYGKGTTR